MRCPPKARTILDDHLAKTEALWCKFVTEHTLPFAVSDCYSDLVPLMFTDTFVCRRTKKAAVVTEALAPDEIDRQVR